MKIIGLTGRARAGKDTTATAIQQWCREHGIWSERLALADPLKASAAAALGVKGTLDEAVAFCEGLKHHGRITVAFAPSSRLELSGREYLQNYGTEAHRDVFGERFWTNVARVRLDDLAEEGVEVAIITDVRFDNEAEFVHDVGGEVWQVLRPAGVDEITTGLEHTSEAGVSAHLLDQQIRNFDSIEALTQLVGVVCDLHIDLMEDK